MGQERSTLSVAELRVQLSQRKRHPGAHPAPGPNTNKYRARRTETGGFLFDSALEARVYSSLVLMRSAAQADQRVVTVERQVRYLLVPAQDGERASHYVADFRVTYADGRVDVVDAKSAITRKHPLYVLKRKLMLERHGIRVREV